MNCEKGICEAFLKDEKIALRTIGMILGTDPKTHYKARSKVRQIYGNCLIKALARPHKTDELQNKAWLQAMQVIGEFT